ncbi:MAG: glutaminyl-peptide cyclotransferase [Acidimicrobiales bacterium]
MRVPLRCLAGIVVVSLVGACGPTPDAAPATAPVPTTSLTPTLAPAAVSPWPAAITDDLQEWHVQVLARLPHDETAFTQGLEVAATGTLESTGRLGASTLRLLDPTSGRVLRSTALDADLYGEGLTVVDDEIVQLTWRNGIALRYDADTLEPVGEFRYEGEGWGLCAGPEGLWMSDGSARLARRDPVTFDLLDSVTVRRGDDEVPALNELECIDDHVVANVWKSDEIVVIDPSSGDVVATIDAAVLRDAIDPADDEAVLNGIADRGDGTLLLGGMWWPTFFVVGVATEGVTPAE